MRHAYTITLDVTVNDPRDLFDAALKEWRRTSPSEPVGVEDCYREFIGTRANPDITGCLRMLADPGVSWPGTQINDSSAEFVADEDADGVLGLIYGEPNGVDTDEDGAPEYRYDPGVAVLFSDTSSEASTPPDTLVVIVRPLSVEEGEVDAEVGPMYRVSDKDGKEYDAFEDELSAPASVVHTLPEDWNGAPLA